MKTMLKNQFIRFCLLAIFMFVLAACGGASEEEVREAVETGVEQALANMPTATPAPTPVPVNPAAIAAEVMALMPTPVPTPTATPVALPTPEIEGEVTATPEPAITPTPDATVGITTTISPTFSLEVDGFDGPIVMTGWAPIELSPNGDWYDQFTALDSWSLVAQTWKQASESCVLPGACNVYGPEGVLGADDYSEAEANPSAVWTGSMWHDSPDNNDSSFAILCPEGSYCDMYALNFGRVEIGPAGSPFITLEIPTCGEHCGQGLLIRNWLSREGVDLNTTIIVSNYGEPGAASWTEYVVNPDNAEYFSQDYHTDQALNAHVRNNNGSGSGDNDRFYQWVLDLNDMSLTLMLHTETDGWVLIWTNVQDYGTH